MRGEFLAIQTAFGLLPQNLTPNAAVVVNNGGTGMTTTTGALALAGNLTTTGAFNTTLTQRASVTLTLPAIGGTLATLAGTETLTNKTLTSPAILGATLSGTTTLNGGVTATSQTITGGTFANPTFSGTVTGPDGGTWTSTGISPSSIPTFGYLSGLKLSTAGSSTTFGVAAGQATDSTNVHSMVLASAYTKTTSAWAVGSANGGLDTGTIAVSTWFHAHLIKRLDTGVVDVLFSLSATAPTLPANYTVFRRIGSMKTTSGSVWRSFTQNSDEFILTGNDLILQATGWPGGGGTLTQNQDVPTGVKVQAHIVGYYQDEVSNPGESAFVIQNPLEASTPQLGNAIVVMNESTGTAGIDVWRLTDTSGNLVYSSVGAGSFPLYRLTNTGWIDTRGK